MRMNKTLDCRLKIYKIYFLLVKNSWILIFCLIKIYSFRKITYLRTISRTDSVMCGLFNIITLFSFLISLANNQVFKITWTNSQNMIIYYPNNILYIS